MNTYLFLLVCCVHVTITLGHNNGVARTPPMGWLAWERFRCTTDCKTFPNDCISENLFHDMADRLSNEGWLDVGYEFVNIDDCWMARERDSQGRLYGDPTRFPNGIKSLADYMHSKGLKLGIYEDFGKMTCGGYPGSEGHEETDANTFASWGVDMLKFDGCYSNDSAKAIGYPLMSQALNKTGRHIVYSCSWPAYEGGLPPKVNYTELGDICNLWRNYNDIGDSWDDVVNIINWWGTNQDALIPAAGPGRWNDPDMLIVGDFSLSLDQSKAQFGMWAILAAPLLMSNDLRNIRRELVEVLQNKEVIAVSQDRLGIQGRRYLNSNGIQVWSRPLDKEEFAVAVLCTATGGSYCVKEFSLSELNITKAPYYVMHDLFEFREVGQYGPKDKITVYVNPNGILMYRVVPMKMEIVEQEEIVIDLL